VEGQVRWVRERRVMVSSGKTGYGSYGSVSCGQIESGAVRYGRFGWPGLVGLGRVWQCEVR